MSSFGTFLYWTWTIFGCLGMVLAVDSMYVHGVHRVVVALFLAVVSPLVAFGPLFVIDFVSRLKKGEGKL